jgi:hypothetical protein
MSSEYSPAETNMIMCMTREMKCSPEKCLTPNSCWMREESRLELIKLQKEWEVNQEAK